MLDSKKGIQQNTPKVLEEHLIKGEFSSAEDVLQSNPNLIQAKLICGPLIHCSLQSVNNDFLKFLLTNFKQNLNFNEESQSKLTPLQLAITKNNVAAVLLLLQNKVDINYVSSQGMQALHVAVLENKPEIVTILLENNANLAFKSPQGTPLQISVQKNLDEVSLRLIKFQNAIDFLVIDQFKNSVLHNVIIKCNNKIFEALIEKLQMLSAKNSSKIQVATVLNIQNTQGNTVLHLSKSQGNQMAFTKLKSLGVELGLNPEIKNLQGKIADQLTYSPITLSQQQSQQNSDQVQINFLKWPKVSEQITTAHIILISIFIVIALGLLLYIYRHLYFLLTDAFTDDL